MLRVRYSQFLSPLSLNWYRCPQKGTIIRHTDKETIGYCSAYTIYTQCYDQGRSDGVYLRNTLQISDQVGYTFYEVSMTSERLLNLFHNEY